MNSNKFILYFLFLIFLGSCVSNDIKVESQSVGNNHKSDSSQRIVNHDNAKYQFWYKQGMTQLNSMRNEEAVDSYNKALSISPNSAWIWNNRGYALYHLEKYTEALDSFNKALEIDPTITFSRKGLRMVREKL